MRQSLLTGLVVLSVTVPLGCASAERKGGPARTSAPAARSADAVIHINGLSCPF